MATNIHPFIFFFGALTGVVGVCPDAGCEAAETAARGKGEPHFMQTRSPPGFSDPQFVQVTGFSGVVGGSCKICPA